MNIVRTLFFIFLSVFLFIGCTHASPGPVETKKAPVFRTSDLFENHYQKHVRDQKEFGNITKEEYLARAQKLVSQKAGGSVLQKKNSEGDTIYYDKATNEFAVLSKDGYIRTFFKPQDRIAYFNRQ